MGDLYQQHKIKTEQTNRKMRKPYEQEIYRLGTQKSSSAYEETFKIINNQRNTN